MKDSQDIEDATANVPTEGRPDQKTRRYDRQLRLWAASGQAALENARILVISASATSTSILKNLVLPGIGHFTILDNAKVTPEDAGNNFFLEGQDSIGKWRAEEAVRLLLELNDGVTGEANTSDLGELLDKSPEYLTSFTVVIAHNLETSKLERLASLLWSDPASPVLFTVDSAGFLAEFSIQFHEHDIIESHSENTPSLRIDKPFPALLEHALSLDLANMDQTEHAHIPYVVLLVRALEDWKATHGGKAPATFPEKKAFKAGILAMSRKFDEENIEEAEAQAYRCWTSSSVPSDVAGLLSKSSPSSENATPFQTLVAALKAFTEQPPHTLPLTSTLPDMKASTESYIHLQKFYKAQADQEKAVFRSFLTQPVDDDIVDSFVKNAHGIKLIKGSPWGKKSKDEQSFGSALASEPKAAGTHLALLALRALNGQTPSIDTLTAAASALVPPHTSLPTEFEEAVGELSRAPNADLPNTAAFLGGLVAQEIIKMITHQYVPIDGVCIIDLIETWTAVLA